MTTNKHTMALTELAEKGADVDLLREIIQFVAQRLMDMNVETLCGDGLNCGEGLHPAAGTECARKDISP